MLSPPPPRGSTVDDDHLLVEDVVSPAPAGIHPIPSSASIGSLSLPRPRGDPPGTEGHCSSSLASPPPPRGSTRYAIVTASAGTVSPAPAGIHPLRRKARPDLRRLPRPRGDPPETMKIRIGKAASPPPPRGSTRQRHIGQARKRVSPAPAGIHPRSSRGCRMVCRLPRPRGDPPRCGNMASRCAPSPPPPRGSTRVARLAELAARVSPAPAGIHPL